MSLWLPCGLHGFAVPNTVTVTVTLRLDKPSAGPGPTTGMSAASREYKCCAAPCGGVAVGSVWLSDCMMAVLWLSAATRPSHSRPAGR